MAPRPVVTRTVSGLAVVLSVIAFWLAHDNPDIDDTSRGDPYTCLAPWDTVRNNADNFPGGEPPPDGDEIAARCREAGERRFTLALVSAGASVITAAAGVAVSRRRSTGSESGDRHSDVT